jgi:hypothetical protein
MQVLASFDFQVSSLDPAAPAAGFGRLYARSWAGRTLPWWKGPSGVSYALSPHWGENNIRIWRGAATLVATTYAGQIGVMPYTGASPVAPTIPALVTASLREQTKRSVISTAATVGSLAYIRANQTEVWRGAGTLGGFLVVHRFAINTTPSPVVGIRCFAGLTDVVANPTNVDPTATTTPGGIGLAIAANSGNWKLVNNASGTARTALDLGANFALNADLLELALWCAPNDSGISYQVTNLTTGNTASGKITTNIPTNLTFLAPVVWVTNNATAAAQTLDFISTYVETDY